MHYVVVGLSHKTAPVSLREKVSLTGEALPVLLTRLIQHNDVGEVLVLSTCNRTEVYLVSPHPDRAECAVREALFPGDSSSSRDSLYCKTDAEAIRHLFRVASGLDSMVVGETQILGQVKEAYAEAVSTNTCGPFLNKALHRTLNVAKKVRSETGIGRLPVSVSYAAVLLAERIFGDLKEKKVLMLGAGEAGLLAAKYLTERGVRKLWISNRTGEKAENHAATLGAEAVAWKDWKRLLEEADIVITSTSAGTFLIHAGDVSEAMRRRKNRAMFFIDIAVPRNVDPSVNQVENVYLYDIDHLQSVVDENRKEREREAAGAEEIILKEVDVFLDYLRQMELSPTIRDLSLKLEKIRQGEVERCLARTPGLSATDRDALEACTHAIVNKILHEPIVSLKTESGDRPAVTEWLRRIFRLGEDEA